MRRKREQTIGENQGKLQRNLQLSFFGLTLHTKTPRDQRLITIFSLFVTLSERFPFTLAHVASQMKGIMLCNSKDHERHFHCKYQYKGKYEEKKGTDNRRESRETSKKLAAFVFWVDTAHKDTQRSKTYHHLQPVCYIIRKISFYSCTCRESDERNNAMSSAVLGKDDIR